MSAATVVKNRLLRLCHPDRARLSRAGGEGAGGAGRSGEGGNELLWSLRNAATAHVVAQWSRLKPFFPGGAGRPCGSGEGGQAGASERGQGAQAGLSESSDLCVGIVRTGGGGVGGAVEGLDRMARTGNLLHNPDIGTYIGFGEYLSMTGCVFEPLGTNRVVSPDVIARRVAANLSEQASSGRYCQFGSISLCAVRGDDSVDDSGHVEHAGVEGGAPRSAGGTTAKFFVLDGQHRLGVMRELRQINPATPIHFELRCTVVQSGEEATACLHAMQDAYPPDARLFFDGRVENVLASHLLDFARHRWPLLFREELPREWSERRGTLRMDPPRPFLNAGVFFDLVRDFGVGCL